MSRPSIRIFAKSEVEKALKECEVMLQEKTALWMITDKSLRLRDIIGIFTNTN